MRGSGVLLSATWGDSSQLSPIGFRFSGFEYGCAYPVSDPWEDPLTIAAGLLVPAPLGGRLILRALAESGGAAVAVSDEEIIRAQQQLATSEGVDAGPEGGATLAALALLQESGTIAPDD